MIKETKTFKAILTSSDIMEEEWFGFEYGDRLTIELEKKDFPFIEKNMEVKVTLTVEYIEKNGKGNSFNKNGIGYNSEEHN